MMTEENKIEQLLTSFYDGTSTVEEEKMILQLLNKAELDEKWHQDRDLFRALYESPDCSMPKNFSQRLESKIDRHIKENGSVQSAPSIKTFFIRISSAAAIALLCISTFFFLSRNPGHLSDTYSDPAEAAVAAEQALMFVAAKLNAGLSSMDKVNESINKTNEIINKKLKYNH